MPDLDRLWKQALERVQSALPNSAIETILKGTRPLASVDHYEGTTVVIAAPNHFVRTYIQERFSPALAAGFSEILGRPANIELIVAEDASSVLADLETAAAGSGAAATDELPPAYQQRPLNLNPKYVFDTFVVGSGNRFAHAAALAVAESPARAYNPLFLYGGVGLGKTHLMQAIAHRVLSNRSGARVVYISTETFANEMISAIREGNTAKFRNRYRNVDILLVDDIQFLAGKESSQEEFFHTFNALHESNRQIVISGDRPPKEIPTLEERLRSRFEWGLISDIQPPDLETRIAILQKKADSEGLHLPDEAILYIAQMIDSNIRELEGALIRVVAYASLTSQEPDLELVQNALRDIIPQQPKRPVTIELIQQVVAEHYGINIRDFKLRRRTHNIAFPRQVAMYLSREMTDSSLLRIGEAFGGRDHTTVIYAHEKISRDAAANEELARTLKRLQQAISGGSA